jgi:hypothetical protein
MTAADVSAMGISNVERTTRLCKATPKAFARHGGQAEQAGRQA